MKRNRIKALFFELALIPLAFIYAAYYASYHHFGMTELAVNFVGNRLTLESAVYGLVTGLIIAGVMIWSTCVFSVFTTDKVVYLLGALSPRLSLAASIILRMVPRSVSEARKINTARAGIGRAIGQGNIFRRTVNAVNIFSILITWLIGTFRSLSDSMRSRGSTLRGRTAFSIYRFDYRDRLYVIVMFFFITVTMAGYMLRQTVMIYDPRLMWNPVSFVSYIFYTAYALFCLMPFMLEVYTEWSFRRARADMLR
ncbi:MAG: hypothetical protein J5822_01925 [Eubacteriaceae bacterium]|nr:hypothetical protein [Eubacteriaceae bacterium]